MILAYRYIRDKRRKAKAAREAQEQGLTPPPSRTASDDAQTVQGQVPSPGAPTTPSSVLSSTLKWRILLMVALLVPVLFETLDYTVVATAQVEIASTFDRLDLQSYIGTVYLLATTVFLPLFASLADIWGRHWALQFSLFLFMLGSAVSTGSQNMPTMLVGRGIAGIGAGGMMALVRIIMSDSRNLDDNNWQQSMLFFLFTIGYCIGPVIGGALTTITFRWIFAINLPASFVAMILCFFILRGRTQGAQTRGTTDPSTPEDVPRETFAQKLLRIDWVGAFFFMAGGITLLLALNWGSATTTSWSEPRVIACFVVAGVSYLAWGAWEYALERRVRRATASRNPLMRTDPMISLELFASADLCLAQYGFFVSGMVMIVMFYFVAIFFTIVTGLTGTQAGVQLLYFAPGLGAGALTSIILMKRLRQPKPLILVGNIITTVALGLVSWAMDLNDKTKINGFLVMAGVGVGMCIGPLAIHCRFSQPDSRVAVVSALTLFSRALGGTVGLAQCGAVLNAKVASRLTSLLTSGALDAADAAALSRALAAGITSDHGIDSLPAGAQALVREAFQQGSRWAFVSLVPWAGLAVVAAVFLSNIQDSETRARVAAEAREAEVVAKEMSATPKEAISEKEVRAFEAREASSRV